MRSSCCSVKKEATRRQEASAAEREVSLCRERGVQECGRMCARVRTFTHTHTSKRGVLDMAPKPACVSTSVCLKHTRSSLLVRAWMREGRQAQHDTTCGTPAPDATSSTAAQATGCAPTTINLINFTAHERETKDERWKVCRTISLKGVLMLLAWLLPDTTTFGVVELLR